MARLGHGIGECLLMVHLGHLGSLKSKLIKLKLNENYMKIKIKWKSKYDLKTFTKLNQLLKKHAPSLTELKETQLAH